MGYIGFLLIPFAFGAIVGLGTFRWAMIISGNSQWGTRVCSALTAILIAGSVPLLIGRSIMATPVSHGDGNIYVGGAIMMMSPLSGLGALIFGAGVGQRKK